MNLIDYYEKQKAIRLKQKEERDNFITKLNYYKENKEYITQNEMKQKFNLMIYFCNNLEQEYYENEHEAMQQGLLNVKFGDFAEKLMKKLNIKNYTIKATVYRFNSDNYILTTKPATTPTITVTIEIIYNKIKSILFENKMSVDNLGKKLSDFPPHTQINLENPEKIEINKDSLTLINSNDILILSNRANRYNYGSPFNSNKFKNKLIDKCIYDKILSLKENDSQNNNTNSKKL